jgi:ubiquinone/menaquinone biosynthesis C-methylase UbiE
MDFDDKAKTWDSDPVKQERAEAVAAAIRQRIPLSSAWRAIEYGCGTGLLSFALHADLGAITLADASLGMLAVLEAKLAAAQLDHLHPLRLDLTCDPLPSDRYDLIYSLMTLHHVAEIEPLLRDFHALLLAGRLGWLSPIWIRKTARFMARALPAIAASTVRYCGRNWWLRDSAAWSFPPATG